jgi:Protein of unknown function (DUF2716)
MSKDAWIELAYHRYDKVWDCFDEAFQFRPSVRHEDWPTFWEPAPSVTWDISDLLAEFNPWGDPQSIPYNLALLKALKEHVAEDEPVLALDWQHCAYEFYPHRFRRPEDPKSWCVPALPSGEYHIFITEDHRLGSLGHPWAQTLCVFGQGFADAYRLATPLQKNKIIRQQPAEGEKRRPRSGKEKRGSHRHFGRRE